MAAQQSFALPLPDDVTPIAPTQVLAHSPFTALTICQRQNSNLFRFFASSVLQFFKILFFLRRFSRE